MGDKYSLYGEANAFIDEASAAKAKGDIKAYLNALKKAAINLYEYAKLEYDPDKKKQAISRADRIYSLIKSYDGKTPRNEMVTNEREETTPELVASISDCTFDQVIGLENAKELIQDEIIDRLNGKYSRLYEEDDFVGGILLYGVPGTGKTMFARAVAGEIKAPFYNQSAKDLIDKYVGESGKNIAKLFQEMRKNRLSVLLLDDSDELFGKRKDESQSYDIAVANAIIREMDGFEKDKDHQVLVIATTNRPQAFDSAILRRFTQKIRIDLPNLELRKKLLDVYSNHYFHEDFITKIAEKIENFSGADIKHLCEDARRIARKRNKTKIDQGEEITGNILTKEDLLEALKYRKAEVKQEDLIAIARFEQLYPNPLKGEQEKNESSTLASQEEEKSDFSFEGSKKCYVLPSYDLLDASDEQNEEDTEYIHQCAQKIEDKLAEFSVKAKVVNQVVGPTYTRLDLQLGTGVSVSNVTRYLHDLEICLGCNIREADHDGNAQYFGLEIPNRNSQLVRIKDILPLEQEKGFTIALGKKVDGSVFHLHSSDFTHMLIGGTTGSGKSTFLNSILMQLILKHGPDMLKFVLIDPKRVELIPYKDLPHLCTKLITDEERANIALTRLLVEKERRYQLIEKSECRKIEEYNETAADKLPYIILVIEELADIASKAFLERLSLLAAQGRAAGIKIIVTTQRPSAEIIRGDVKANFPTRIALATSTAVDSRIIIDQGGAEKLRGNGDMLVFNNNKLQRMQSAYVSMDEIKKVVQAIMKENS